MQGKYLWIVAIILFSRHNVSYGLRCYTCSITENDSDLSCADNVESLGIKAVTDCSKKYCIIERSEYRDSTGKLAFIRRSCADKVEPDSAGEDTTFRKYYRSCKTDLCNSGNGKDNSDDSVVPLGDKSTIYVPGTAGGAIYAVSLCGLLFCLALIGLFQF